MEKTTLHVPRIRLQLTLRQSELFQSKKLDQFFSITTRPQPPLNENNTNWIHFNRPTNSTVRTYKGVHSATRLPQDFEGPFNSFYDRLNQIEVKLDYFYKQLPKH